MTSRTDARAAGLRFADESQGGIGRRRCGKAFSYRRADGTLVRDATTLKRIRALAIPPAWTGVWICPDPAGHLQATGRDARRRKQYRYHTGWRTRRDRGKFDRLPAFAKALPVIRAACDADLVRSGLPREKVLAAVVRLLELTRIRVGSDEYVRLYRSFGLTTLRDRHVVVTGSTIRFRFRGKAGRIHDVDLRDRRLASVVRRCQDLPGQDLFQYVDDAGTVRHIRSDDVNDYLRSICEGDFTAKDFRTWSGTVAAFRSLRSNELPTAGAAARRSVAAAMRDTAEILGNTPAVARAGYVHPAVIGAYLAGDLEGGPASASGEDPIDQGPATDEEAAALTTVLSVRRRVAAVRA